MFLTQWILIRSIRKQLNMKISLCSEFVDVRKSMGGRWWCIAVEWLKWFHWKYFSIKIKNLECVKSRNEMWILLTISMNGARAQRIGNFYYQDSDVNRYISVCLYESLSISSTTKRTMAKWWGKRCERLEASLERISCRLMGAFKNMGCIVLLLLISIESSTSLLLCKEQLTPWDVRP